MPTLQDKIDKRANIWEQMKAINDRNTAGTATQEDLVAYERAEAEYDAIDREITVAEAHERRALSVSNFAEKITEIDERAKASTPEDKAYATAFDSWMRGGLEAVDHDQKAVLRNGWVDGKTLNAASTSSTAGGYTIPPEFRDRIIETMKFVSSMRQDSEVITTATGANLPWPTNDDTGNEGAILAENTQVTEQDFTFGQGSIDAYMYTSKLVRVSLQLLNDSAFNLEQWLPKKLGERLGRIQQRHFTVGTGTGQPDGLFVGAPVGKTAAATAAITTDELIDLQESIDPLVEAAGNCVFEFHQTTRTALRKLKYTSGTNAYIWQPSLEAGKPSTLLGAPVKVNNYVPTLATGAKTVGYGDKRQAYLIRDVQEMTLLRLAERYADFLQVGFLAFLRTDGTVQDTNAFKLLQQA